MKKLLLFFITGILISGLNAQDIIIPEIVNEQLNNEQLDLTITNDDQETNISEENYYFSIPGIWVTIILSVFFGICQTKHGKTEPGEY